MQSFSRLNEARNFAVVVNVWRFSLKAVRQQACRWDFRPYILSTLVFRETPDYTEPLCPLRRMAPLGLGRPPQCDISCDERDAFGIREVNEAMKQTALHIQIESKSTS
jgi:hypothetical protein